MPSKIPVKKPWTTKETLKRFCSRSQQCIRLTATWRKANHSTKTKRIPSFLKGTPRAKVFECVDHNKLWKILKEMGIPDHLTCLLKNLYAGQEATVRTGYGTTDWFQIGKRVHQGCTLSPCLFNFSAEYIMRNAGLEETQAGIKIGIESERGE